jgi:glycosyltransferase involved in cell wall biosynthesis
VTAPFPQYPTLRWAGERPRISVIIIFLNAERFIEEAIASVLAQDYADLELILVDDGSAEVCESLAKSYAERFAPFVRYACHAGHVNRGMSASRNLGLAQARGEFVAFIDADDVWAPNKLGEQLAIMDAHPRLGMVCGAVRYWYSWDGGVDTVVPTGHAQDRVVEPPEATLELYPLGRAAAPCPSDLLLRLSAVERVGGFEEHFTGANQMYEDQGFLAKLYLSSPCYFSSRVWLSYRQHAESCVSEVKRSGRYLEVRRYFLNWFAEYLARRPERSRRVEVALWLAHFRYAHPRLFRAGQLGKQTLRRAKQLLGRA